MSTTPTGAAGRSRATVRICSVIARLVEAKPWEPVSSTWLGHPRSIVVIGSTRTSVVTAPRYPSLATTATGRRPACSRPRVGDRSAQATLLGPIGSGSGDITGGGGR